MRLRRRRDVIHKTSDWPISNAMGREQRPEVWISTTPTPWRRVAETNAMRGTMPSSHSIRHLYQGKTMIVAQGWMGDNETLRLCLIIAHGMPNACLSGT